MHFHTLISQQKNLVLTTEGVARDELEAVLKTEKHQRQCKWRDHKEIDEAPDDTFKCHLLTLFYEAWYNRLMPKNRNVVSTYVR